MSRGELRIYLGAAPGVGKTYAMLDEARRRRDRGTDAVVGIVETHGRAKTMAMVSDLEVLPRRAFVHRGRSFEEMDLDAIVARQPELVCVDELAHTNIPGSEHEKRWQDVEALLAAGINVLSTVNVQHLESLNDVVAKITGIQQRETVPDAVVRAADQVELVDLTPEALRSRMAHGNIYPAERVDAALSNYFRLGNLTALREIALLWLADKVDDALKQYKRDNNIEETWETRERVVVAVTGGPEGETLIRRASRIASRGGADLLAVYVVRSDGLTGADPAALADQRRLVESLGASFHLVVGDHIAESLLEFARAENATQLVLGASRRQRFVSMLSGPGIGATTVRHSGDIDVHIVSHDQIGRGRGLPQLGGGLSPQRRLAALVLAAIVLPLLTLLLTALRSELNLTSDLLIYLVAVVSVSIVGGLLPSIATAIAASLLLNYYFTPPIHTWTINNRNNVIALIAFLIVAAAVSSVVDLAARRTAQSARAVAESATLAALAGAELRGNSTLELLLQQLRESLQLDSVALIEHTDEGPRTVATVGPAASDGENFDSIDDRTTLVVSGRPLAATDRRLVGVFAAHAATMLDRQRLSAAADAAAPIAAADRLRTALLAAVSHDLRSPLASATAAVDSLRSTELDWSDEQRAELELTASESLQRLSRLVENLLDMSRLQAGALSVFPVVCRLDEVIAVALDAIGPASSEVVIDIPPDVPEALADPTLLERVVANVASNAIRFAPADQPPRIAVSAHDKWVETRVIDHGPGVPGRDLDSLFTPFQRLGDTDNTTGVGLGLALSRGLAEAMGGELSPEPTPGGGLTMVIRMPVATE